MQEIGKLVVHSWINGYLLPPKLHKKLGKKYPIPAKPKKSLTMQYNSIQQAINCVPMTELYVGKYCVTSLLVATKYKIFSFIVVYSVIYHKYQEFIIRHSSPFIDSFVFYHFVSFYWMQNEKDKRLD